MYPKSVYRSANGPKISPAIIVYIYIKHFILYGLLGIVSSIMDLLHFVLSPTLFSLYS